MIDPLVSHKFVIYLMVYNGKIIRSESLDGDGGLESSALVSEFTRDSVTICNGINDDVNSPDTIQEHMGDVLVTRAKRCNYVIKETSSDMCIECQKVKEISENVKSLPDVKVEPDIDFPDGSGNFPVEVKYDDDDAFEVTPIDEEDINRNETKYSIKDQNFDSEGGTDGYEDDQDFDLVGFLDDSSTKTKRQNSKKRGRPKVEKEISLKVKRKEEKLSGEEERIKKNLKEYIIPSKDKLICSICCVVYKFKCVNRFVKHIHSHFDAVQSELINKVSDCTKCEAKFRTKWEIIPHLMEVHNLKGKICVVCPDKAFDEDVQLNRHWLYWHDPNHKAGKNLRLLEPPKAKPVCTECGQPARNIIKHMQLVHPDTSKPMKVCEACGYECHTQYQMYKHMARQHPSKAYVCNMCNIEFNQLWIFKKHFRMHQNPKPYKCVLCDYRSYCAHLCLTHIKCSHKNVASNKDQAVQYRIKDGEFDELSDEQLKQVCTIKDFQGGTWNARNDGKRQKGNTPKAKDESFQYENN